MTIDPTNMPMPAATPPASPRSGKTDRGLPVVRPGGAPAAPPPPADRLALSARAEAFRRARIALGEEPAGPQTERIERLRALVARDAYSVTGIEIAEAMLRDSATASLLGVPRPRGPATR